MKLRTVAVLLWVAPLSSWAQQHAPTPKIKRISEPCACAIIYKTQKPWLPVPGKVYVYVEQMPELPSGSGTWRIVTEIQKLVSLPTGSVEPGCYRTFAYFEVSSAGVVQHARIEKTGGSVVVDAAVLRAVRSLPMFKPGRQAGQAVAVSFTMPIRIATQ